MQQPSRPNTAVLNNNRWMIFNQGQPAPNQTPNLRLFCFSHAGGNASAYRQWQPSMPAGVEVCAIQLPGRGARISEPAYGTMTELVDNLAQAISPYLDLPFAFFGHSMGAMVAFELCRTLRRQGLPQPKHLFLSACRAPQFNHQRQPLHKLPKTEFLAALRRLNGTPKEALEHAELMELLEPVLRADFQVIETYRYQEEAPLSVPITVFGGDQDDGTPAEFLRGWQQHSRGGFWLRLFPGDHFYLQQQQTALLRQISDLLCLTPRLAM